MARHAFDCPLRWFDMDAAGHIDNVAYLRYLEEARIDALAVHPLRRGAEGLGWAVIAEMDIEYLKPLAYRAAPIRIEAWVTRIGTSSFGLGHRFFDGDTLHARAQATLVPPDPATLRSRPLREEERAALEALADDQPGMSPWEESPAGTAPESVHLRRHIHHCQLRLSDMGGGHINNAVYVTYLEEARLAMFDAVAPGRRAAFLGGVVVARHRIRYHAGLVFRPEPVRIESWIGRVGRSSFTVEHEIRDDDVLYCHASSVIVMFDARTGRSRPLRLAERAALKVLLDPVATPGRGRRVRTIGHADALPG
nr:hypothetical protein asmbl_25 [uncultured bacterium]